MGEREFPPIEAFKNSLGNKVFDDDYAKAREFFNLHCTTFRDYHDYYLRQDVLILTDALIKVFHYHIFYRPTGPFKKETTVYHRSEYVRHRRGGCKRRSEHSS